MNFWHFICLVLLLTAVYSDASQKGYTQGYCTAVLMYGTERQQRETAFNCSQVN